MPFSEITFSEWIQIIISLLSLIATIGVSIAIFWLQSRHEKEMQSLEQKQRQRDLEEEAKIFLMDHDDQRDYLPWCILAANRNRLKKHHRKIYHDYCRCRVELQNEILKQAGFTIKQIEDTQWVDDAFESLREDIKTYKLGRDVLYDGAKYFHRGYEKYSGLEFNDNPAIFEPFKVGFEFYFNRNKVSIGEYIREYFYYHIGKRLYVKEHEPLPPIDYVWNVLNLESEEESVVCAWVMELVEAIADKIPQKENLPETTTGKESPPKLDLTDAIIETYEDKYYSALQSLYNTYCVGNFSTKGFPNRNDRYDMIE